MPDLWFDVDTALSEVPVNLLPIVVAAGDTIDDGLTYNEAGLDLNWNFVTTAGAFTQTNVTPTDTAGVHDWVNQGNGMYTIEIPATGGTIDNDTEGAGWFTGFATAVLPWRGPVCGFRDSDLNNELINSAYTSTRGLGGTYLDASVAGIPTTAMRGTDDAALASVLGALADAAAAGEVTTEDTLMKYMKQLINILIGAAGIAAFPSSAAPANDVSIVEVIRAIYDDSHELQGLISSSKLAAQVKGMDADVLTASALKADAVTEIMGGTIDEATTGANPTTLKGKVQAIFNRLFANRTITETLETAYEKDDSSVMETFTLTDDDTTASRSR